MVRRLTTILAADVAGFSRLVGIDEEGTITAQCAHRRALIDPLVERHAGRIANTGGDSLLIEFPSAVEAVRMAVAMQEGMRSRNADTPDDQRIEYRIGINVGDVLAEGDDLLGDGVNVASRIQELCEPGGIFVSSAVHEQVAGKFDQAYDDLGHRKVKNIPHLVHVYRVHLSDLPPEATSRGLFERPAAEGASLETGRCMCGAIRFEITQPAIDVGLCHCRMCQRFNSAPFSVWAVFPVEAVRFAKGEPKYYVSSPIGERGFCPDCGSSLTMTHYAPDRADILAVLAPALDQPENYPPSRHVCVESRMPWLDLNDSLPRICSWEMPHLLRRWGAVGFPDPADWKAPD